MSADNPFVTTYEQDMSRIDSPHAPRFRMIIGLLTVIAVVAIAVAVVLASDHTDQRALPVSTHWSSWAPDGNANEAAEEIAQYVSPFYRASGSQQLDVVSPMQLAETDDAGTVTGSGLTVALEAANTSSRSLQLLNGKTIGYNVCGLGPKNCELTGTASINRMLLLRREALELALYTFRYVGSAQNVVVVLPPGHTVTTGGADDKGLTVALVFLRSSFSSFLNVPLSRTLAAYPLELSELTSWSKTQDASLVDELTSHFLFSSQVETLQEGGSALVLTQLPAQ
jgi:hypothetical protein